MRELWELYNLFFETNSHELIFFVFNFNVCLLETQIEFNHIF